MTIIDRKNKFIYLKSHKTAGTSTEIYLITKTDLGLDIYRTAQDIEKYGFPRKRKDREFARFRNAFPSSSPSVTNWVSAARLKFGSRMRVREHMTGDEVSWLVGAEFFDQSLVVANIRNPWDALVSMYKWQKSGRGGRSQPIQSSFSDFLYRSLTIGDDRITAAERYLFAPYLNGRDWTVDDVIIFECLHSSVDRILKEYGVRSTAASITSIHEKRTRRKGDYRRWYTDKDAQAVEMCFSGFLSRFVYDFDDPGMPPTVVSL